MSPAETVRRYVTERYGARFVMLAVLLAICGAAATGIWSVGSFARSALVAWLAVLALRVWDDLEDRFVDAIAHPSRVSVLADARVLRGLALLAGAGALALCDVPRGVIALAVVVVLFEWYRLRPTNRPAAADACVLMLKYPVIAVIAAPVLPAVRALPLLIALYLLLCLHEWLDDPRLRHRRASIARGTLP